MKTVLVLRAPGLFGRHAATAFANAGWQVRRVVRGTDMTAAATKADVILNALNPPDYHDWAALIPQITAHVIAAGQISGATVLVPGNVYVCSIAPAPWGPDTPHLPVTRKGRIRAQMEADYRAATMKGLRVILLRVGDYIAPEQPGAILNRVVLQHLARCRITALGDPATRCAYAYPPDMTRAAVMLGERRAGLPAFAVVPFAGDAFSITDLAAALSRLSGRSLRATHLVWLPLRFLSPV